MISTHEIDWTVSNGLTNYDDALLAMESHVANIRAHNAREKIWLVEHPPVYTAGTSARSDDLIDANRFPVFNAGRGGQYTYHGPGQRVGYLMLDLEKRGRDIRKFVHAIEQWLISTLQDFDIHAFTADGRVGLWVNTPEGEAKIAAIGIRVKKWVSFHGFSINVSPNLDHFAGIVPCGLPEYAVTSLSALGHKADLHSVDQSLLKNIDVLLAAMA